MPSTRSALSAQARNLLLVFLFVGLANPLVGTFIGVFLWRQGRGLFLLMAYMLAHYACLPAGFFLSYRLLGRFTHRTLFAIGMVVTGVVPFGLVFLPGFSSEVVIGFGVLYGLASGFLWSTRNYLTLNATTKTNRLSFSAMEGVFGTVSGILVPFVTGWILEIGPRLGWFSLDVGYRWMGFIGLMLLAIAGYLVHDKKEPRPLQPTLGISLRTRQWQTLRALDFTQGLMQGLGSVLSLAFVVSFLGTEGAIGTVGSIGAFVSAMVLVGLGRRLSHERRLPVLAVPIVIDILIAILVLLLKAPYGIIFYLVATPGTLVLRWWVTGATMYHAIEVEERCTASSREGLLMDREWILNVGRVVGLLIFLCVYLVIPRISIMIAPLVIASIQIGLYPLCRALDGLAKKEECAR